MFEEIRSEVKKLKTDTKELRKFAIVMASAFGILSIIAKIRDAGSFPYLLGIAVVFLAIGLIAPAALKQVYRGWMTFAFVLGYLMTRVILTLLFFLVFLPIGLIIRLTQKDLLDEQFDSNAATYWKHYEKTGNPKQRLERQF